MIDLHGQAGLPYVNKGVYTGSFQGMRYRLRKKEEGEEKLLEAVIYPEPFCFEVTAEDGSRSEYRIRFSVKPVDKPNRLELISIGGKPVGGFDGGYDLLSSSSEFLPPLLYPRTLLQ